MPSTHVPLLICIMCASAASLADILRLYAQRPSCMLHRVPRISRRGVCLGHSTDLASDSVVADSASDSHVHADCASDITTDYSLNGVITDCASNIVLSRIVPRIALSQSVHVCLGGRHGLCTYNIVLMLPECLVATRIVRVPCT